VVVRGRRCGKCAFGALAVIFRRCEQTVCSRSGWLRSVGDVDHGPPDAVATKRPRRVLHVARASRTLLQQIEAFGVRR